MNKVPQYGTWLGSRNAGGLLLLLTVISVGGAQPVINEIHYDPDIKTDWVEFVELYNPTDQAIDLAGWSLADAVAFTFPPGAVLPAGSHVVVAQDVNAMQRKFYGAVPSHDFLGMVQLMRDYVRLVTTQTRNWHGQSGLSLVDPREDPAVPRRAVIRHTGTNDFAVNDLHFATQPLGDPQGASASKSLIWRLGEVEAFGQPSVLPAAQVIGSYEGRLANGGERITLTDTYAGVLLDFSYQDNWHVTTDGQGYSLTLRDPFGPHAGPMEDTGRWQASPELLGAPGQ